MKSWWTKNTSKIFFFYVRIGNNNDKYNFINVYGMYKEFTLLYRKKGNHEIDEKKNNSDDKKVRQA